MRIQIVGEKEIVEALSNEVTANGQDVKPITSAVDRTEFAFGLDEIAAVVTMVDVAIRLAPHIVAVARSMKPGDAKKLAVKSSFGAETIMLHKDIPREEVEGHMRRLEPPTK